MISVFGVARVAVTEGDTAYVFDGGVVDAAGGRVQVGSGGRCVASGGARVWLVEDGVRLVDADRPGPMAWLDDGELFAETGTGFVAGSAVFRATGDAEVHSVPGAGGRIEDGRRVTHLELPVDQVAAARDRVGSAGPWSGADTTMSAEPGADAESWLRPLVATLAACGGTPGERRTTRSGSTTVVHAGDPRGLLECVVRRLAWPPTVRIVPRGEGFDLVTTYGEAVSVERSGAGLAGLLGRRRGR